jgi:hypothetical protein
LEAESFVEPQSRIDFHDGQANSLIQTGGLTYQAMHHFSADAFALKRAIYKELSNKESIIFYYALQPANVGTVEGDDADLRHRPLLAKTNCLSSHIQMQFLNDFRHSCEVQTFAVFEILGTRGAKCDLRWLIHGTARAMLVYKPLSLEF